MSKQAIIAKRRAHVAKLALRGMSQREIVAALERLQLVNPKTGRPFSLGTVNSDLKRLEAEWLEAALRDRAELRARKLAELQELKRLAWGQQNHRLVLDLLKEEARLMALYKLGEVNVNFQQNTLEANFGYVGEMSERELDKFIDNLTDTRNSPKILPEKPSFDV